MTAPGTVDLSSIDGGDGTLGFAIKDNGMNHLTGFAVSPAGDVNGDGVGDLIVGAQQDGQGGTGAGAAYVIFGKKGGLPAVINVFNPGPPSDLNGANGFKIVGETGGEHVGTSVSAGDVNHDGLSDLIIGAPDRNGSSGSVYVVFGQKSFSAVLNLSSLNGTAGFRIDGAAAGDRIGSSVSVAGDLNQDGIADFLIGAPGESSGAGAAYVVTGSLSAASSPVAIGSISLFKVTGAAAGDQLGSSVSSAGDVDGDGTPDLILGAFGVNNLTGAAYVLPGPAHGHIYPSSFSISTAGKLTLTGEAANDEFGFSVSRAGDVNGDGFPDLIVGAPGASGISTSAGTSYVFFGQAGGLTGTISGSSLTGANGFKIIGEVQNDGAGFGAGGIGDINGDGYADLVVGAPRAGGSTGAAYVVYGGPSGLSTGAVAATVAVHLQNGVGTFNDVDGDLVTVKLKTQLQVSNFDLLVKSTVSGSSLSQLLELDLGASFEESDLSITVKQEPGGDGRANIGFINAHGVDLGAVTVMGDLGKIVAGSGGTKLALKSLTVDSLGAFGGLSEDSGSDHRSTITGSVGPVKILGDVRDALFQATPTATAGSGKIASLTIGGSVIGSRLYALGEINAVSIGPVKIGGGIVGGSGDYGGELNAGSYSTISVGGSLIGSSGYGTGAIYSGPTDLVPNATGAVGPVKIGGGLLGGSGDDSGQLLGTNFSTITIGGSLLGGAGARSGALEASHTTKISVLGNQIGGAGSFSGSIFNVRNNGTIGKVFIGGSQIGGTVSQSGFIIALGQGSSIAGVTIAGDAIGGTAPVSGGILAIGQLGPVVIKGSVVGQVGAPYTIRGGGALTGATSVAIASLTVGGNFEHALVLGGYGRNNALLNGHAQIGAITIGRDWIASNVLAGVADADGFSFIGNGFDTLINAGGSSAIASIASVTIKGRAMGSAELGDHFGIEAEQIGFVSIRGVKLALKPDKANDTAGFAIGATPDFVVREVGS